MTEKRRAVVFGGAGYVGNAVAEAMKSEFDVVVADVRPPKSTDGLRFLRCDIRKTSEVEGALSGAAAALYFPVVQIPQINSEKRLGYEVNILGLQNVCEAALKSESVGCVVQSGSWHVFGERGLSGTIDETFGFRPDNVEDRAKLYALCKIVQESLMRIFDELGAPKGKTYGVLRMGTVLGERMPEQTAAALFIRNGLKGEPLTPYKNSMYRPMLYVDIHDICRAYTTFVKRSLGLNPDGGLAGRQRHVVNVVWSEPITILELAELVRDAVAEATGGRTKPAITVKDTGLPQTFSPEDKNKFRIDDRGAKELLGEMTDPRETVKRLVTEVISEGSLSGRQAVR